MVGVLKSIIVFIFIVLLPCQIFGQEPVYHWDWKQEGYILGGSILFWTGAKIVQGNSPVITLEDIAMLDPLNVSSFERGAISNNSENADHISDFFLYGSNALPFIHYISKKGRNENLKIVGMTFETILITDGVISLLKGTVNRFRPFTYNPNILSLDKLGDGSRHSFASGHTATVAAFSFFSAKVFSDLHPDSKWKKFVWAGAISAPAITAYLRYEAGRHFPTDVMAGYAIGAAVGYFVPHLHKNKKSKNLSITSAGNGIYLRYQF